jgi:hypothetical protein
VSSARLRFSCMVGVMQTSVINTSHIIAFKSDGFVAHTANGHVSNLKLITCGLRTYMSPRRLLALYKLHPSSVDHGFALPHPGCFPK